MGLLGKLKHRVAGGLEDHHPVLRGLLDGQITIADRLIEEKLRERFKGRLRSMEFRCIDGRMLLRLEAERKGELRKILIAMSVEKLLLSRRERRAIIQFHDPDESLAEDGEGIAGLVDPEGLAEIAEEQSNGVVEIAWPQAILHFERHPELDRILTRRLGPFPALVDMFEIRECRIEAGQIVLPVNRP